MSHGKGGVVLMAAACLALSCGGEEGGPAPVPPSVILISLDTTRADFLGCYGRPDARTPVLDGMALRAVLFTEAVTAANTTLASHTSIMTGLHPQSHGVPENGWIVGEVNTLLAERLGAAGYRTAGVVGSFALARRFGIDQGFDTWDEAFDLLLHPKERDQNQRRAATVTDAAIRALDPPSQGEEAPLFLFVHYFDPHAPYDPPAPFRSRPGTEPPDLEMLRGQVARRQSAAGEEEPLGLQVVFEGLTPGLARYAGSVPDDRDRLLEALYSDEIAYMDSEIGRLIEELERRGLLRESLVVVVGDHGETLWEHGDFYNHGLALYRTTVRVPLLVKLPGDRLAGTTVTEPVSTVDILPTILSILGLEPEGRMEGMDLLGRMEGHETARERVIFSGATQPSGSRFDPAGGGWRNLTRARAVRRGRWKLVHTPYLNTWELFDITDDPHERRNLIRDGRPASPGAAAAAGELRELLEGWAASANPMPSFPSREHIEEVRERLRSLGYL